MLNSFGKDKQRLANINVDAPVIDNISPILTKEILTGFCLLKSPPSLSKMVHSNSGGIKRSPSLSSILSSPSSVSRRSSLALFSKDDNDSGLLLRTFPYEQLDDGCVVNNFGYNYLEKVDNLPEIIKIPTEFLKIMQLLWRRHKIFATWRLAADPFTRLSRRCSMIINGEIIYSPKETNTSTQTGSARTICGGHIARDERFRDKKYRLKDNNHPGAFHKSIAEQACNQRLLSEYQKNISTDIFDVRIFEDGLICFAEMVDNYDKGLNLIAKKPKHYIQEARTLFFVLDIIEKKLGAFISANSNEIVFKDSQDNICKLDLTKLIPKTIIQLPEISNMSFLEFKNYVQNNQLEDYHAPVFNILPNNGQDIIVPVMVLAGKNGLPIAGDVDPENIAERSDAPDIVYKSFNGANDDKQKFIIGLEILAARLQFDTMTKFNAYLSGLHARLQDLDNGQSIIDAYSDFFESDYSLEYTDYTNDEYYQSIYLPIVIRTLDLYFEHPELLNIVGESSIGGLVTQNDCDHELYMHDADNLNPTNELGPMGTTFFYYETAKHPNGKLCVTGNEESYVKFLLHDPEILRNNRFAVHPCRLGNKTIIEDKESGAIWCEEWLDIIKIQALHEASKGINKFNSYKNIVIADMKKRHSPSEDIALAKLNVLFDSVYIYLSDTTTIQEAIDMLYHKYSANTPKIHDHLNGTINTHHHHRLSMDLSI